MLRLHHQQRTTAAAARRPCHSVLAPRRSCFRPQLQPCYSHAQARISTTAAAAARRGGGSGSSGGRKPPRRNNRDEGAPDSSGSELAKTINRMITDSEGITGLSDVFNEWSGSFDYIHTAAAITQAAKLPDNRSDAAAQLLARLAALWEEQLPAADSRQLANVLWACGKLRYANSGLWSSTVAACMQQKGEGAAPQAYANVLYALASIAPANKGAVPGLTRPEVAEVFEQLTGEVYVMAAAPATTVKLHDVSNILWAHAKLGIQPPAADLCGLLKAAVRSQLLGDATAQGLANLLWAVSQLRQRPDWQAQVQQPVWQQLLAEPQLRKLSNGIAMDVANTLFVLSALVLPSPADAAPAVSLEFAQQCAEQVLRGSAVQQLSKWDAQSVSNTMFACAKLGMFDEQLFCGFTAAAPGWLPKAGAAEVNQVALACGQLGFRDTQLLAGLLRRAQPLFKPSKQGKLLLSPANQVTLPASVAWAVAVLDVPELVGSVEQLFVASGIKQAASLQRDSNAARLWFVHTWLLGDHPELLGGRGLAGLLTEQQLEQCEQAATATGA